MPSPIHKRHELWRCVFEWWYPVPCATRKKDKKTESILRFGAYGNLTQTMAATKDKTVETILFDAAGNKVRVDSDIPEQCKGDVIYPSIYRVRRKLPNIELLFGLILKPPMAGLPVL
jgi:hypothetical protein